MEEFITIKEASKRWNITPRRIQKMCSDGRIDGAKKFGRDWAIPIGAQKPVDARVTTGEYRDWRKRRN